MKMLYETQLEVNYQLREQIVTLKEKLGKLSGDPSDIQGTIEVYMELSTRYLVKLLRKLLQEKRRLENQVKYYSVKAEQEERAYKKVKDERQKYLNSLFQVSHLHEIPRRQHMDEFHRRKEIPVEIGRYNTANQKIGNAKRESAKQSRTGVLKLQPAGHMRPAENIYPARRVFLPPLPVLLSSRLVPGPQCACVECLRDSELASCLKSLRTSGVEDQTVFQNSIHDSRIGWVSISSPFSFVIFTL
uniref:Uncharacterized protein n=1 Tax=Myotis myotis TaxID=51298 RepID=A0A7J7YDU2_MYOMY|nr:hypothetical protein mMyoMyo1_011003 [Myotis myotis]